MLRLRVTNEHMDQQWDHQDGPIEIGRGPARDNIPRGIIQGDLFVSRNHLRIEQQDSGKIRVENVSSGNSVKLADESMLLPTEARDLVSPIHINLGETKIAIEVIAADPVVRTFDDIKLPTGQDSYAETAKCGFSTMKKPPAEAAVVVAARRPPPPKPKTEKKPAPSGEKEAILETIDEPMRSRGDTPQPISLSQLGLSPSPETLARWFETIIAVQRAASGSTEFYAQTARALIDLVGLDRGLVLLKRGNNWEVAAREVANKRTGSDLHGRDFSTTILQRVVDERRTFFQSPASIQVTESLAGVEAVVASPIFDAEDQVAGVIYGSRNRIARHVGIGIGVLEAQVVQLLASAAGAGLARLQKEAEVARLRVQFEQFFSEKLARELERNPRLLEGQERPVTIMFCDIRGFSRLAERLGPLDTCRLVANVMEQLATRVREFDGVVVEYMGDGLLAMWNAPTDQPDHAALACRAAVAIMGDMPALSAQWEHAATGPLRVGIGLNTGLALVGNTGSRHKFKYGPFGHAVNLASRVEGATKELGISILISGSTRELVGSSFAVRRIARTRVVGIANAIDLFELHGETAGAEWQKRSDAYEAALELFEQGKWAPACQALYPVLSGQEGQFDIPSLNLLARAVACLKDPPEKFDPVLELTKK